MTGKEERGGEEGTIRKPLLGPRPKGATLCRVEAARQTPHLCPPRPGFCLFPRLQRPTDSRAEPRLGLLFAQGTGTVAEAALPWAGVDFFVCSVLAPALRSRSFLPHRRCSPCPAPQQSVGSQRVRACIRTRLLLLGAGNRGSESASPGGPHPRFPQRTAVRGVTRGCGKVAGSPRRVVWSLGTIRLSGNAPRAASPWGPLNN